MKIRAILSVKVLLFLLLCFISPIGAAQSTMGTVYVIGVSIGGESLCGGRSCIGMFGGVAITQPLPGEESISHQEEDGDLALACSTDASGRETAVFLFYRETLRTRYGIAGALMRDAVNRQLGLTLEVTFSNGSRGVYQRADSELNSTSGFIEVEAPNCG